MYWIIIKSDCTDKLKCSHNFKSGETYVGVYDLYSNLETDANGNKVLLNYSVVSIPFQGTIPVEKKFVEKIN